MKKPAFAHVRVFGWALGILALVLALVITGSAMGLLPLWAALAALAAALAGFAAALYRAILVPMQTSRDEQMEKTYAASILQKQAELDALQSQINPHFLYNTLDSIRGQALVEGVEDIADMTEALSTFFRYSMSNHNHVVTLEEELENIRNYFMIQRFRFSNRFRLQMLPFSQQTLELCRLPKMTLQPILENAILHGMEGKIGPGSITIRVDAGESRTVITISDDGAGMSEETLLRLQDKLRGEESLALKRSKGSGIALPNVNRRIKLLFGDAYGLRVMSTLGLGTDVEICLPAMGGTGDGA